MGNNWSQSEAWQMLATKDEVLGAVRGFAAWEKAQEEIKASCVVQRSAPSTGTLLDRVGGADMVRQVVEAFCLKLYADKRLAVFLQGTDIVSLRAKQSSFMTWLFSPTDQAFTSRHMRTAHLRIIKQHGFSPEDFELGLSYFEAAMKDLGLSEALMKEAMAKIRPYKELAFTPLPRDADDISRWALESRVKQRQQQQQQQQLLLQLEGSQQQAAGGRTGPSEQPPAAAEAPAAPPASPAGPPGAGGRVPSASGRGPQCPFTGGRLSRPASSAQELPASVTDAARRGGLTPPPPSPSLPKPVSTSPPSTSPPGSSFSAGSGVTRLLPLALPALPPMPPLPPMPSVRSSYPSSGVTTPNSSAVGVNSSRQRSPASSFTGDATSTLQSTLSDLDPGSRNSPPAPSSADAGAAAAVLGVTRGAAAAAAPAPAPPAAVAGTMRKRDTGASRAPGTPRTACQGELVTHGSERDGGRAGGAGVGSRLVR